MTEKPTPIRLAGEVLPHPVETEQLDLLFEGPADADALEDPDIASPGLQLVGDPLEMEQRGTMVETGFDGRGRIPVSNPKKKPDHAYRGFIKLLGDDEDHTKLKAALAIAGTTQANRFLSMLLSPANSARPIESLAKRCGIGIPQLRDIWRAARLDEGFMALLNEYPRVMADLARDTRSSRESCRFCSGTGRVIDQNAGPKPIPANLSQAERRKLQKLGPQPVLIRCHSCTGRGWTRKSGSHDARQLMGQILGVSGRPAPVIGVTHNTTNVNLESVINEIEEVRSLKRQQGMYDVTATPLLDKP